MIRLEDAHNILKSKIKAPQTIIRSIIDALGMVIAEDVYSDINMPPFNKSAMDGYACRMSDLEKDMEIVEYISAGTVPKQKVQSGKCSKIMTGAKVPDGADCVIMVEHTKEVGTNKVRFTGEKTKSNICLLGEDVKINDLVIKTGSRLSSASIALLASVGRVEVKVYMPPKVALIATGDELVEPDQIPNEVQIRNSNSYNIQAQLAQTPVNVDYIGIVLDDQKQLKGAIEKGLEHSDILVLTGGVSMGDKDYVPEILKDLGLMLEFDRLAIQPGKPVAFAHGGGKACFGLSGNPVSSLLQFELLVRPYIYYYMQNEYDLPLATAKLSSGKARKKTERMQFFPVRLDNGDAKPIEFHGSAHIAGLQGAGGFAFFPIGEFKLDMGDLVQVLQLPF